MANRWLLWAGLCIALASSAGGARAETGETIEVVISRMTGNISLYNPNATPFAITGYLIETNPGTFNPALWTSITERYDAPIGPTPGDGSVDLDDQWSIFSTPGSTSNLSEGVFGGDGGSLAPGQIVSLGNVWITSVPPDPLLDVSVSQAAVLAMVNFSYIVEGDYSGDDVVDAADYTVWRDAIEAGATTLLNDSTPGSVTEEDFLVWRDHFGESLAGGAGSGSGFVSVATVPEPATVSLLIAGAVGWLVARRRRGAPLP